MNIPAEGLIKSSIKFSIFFNEKNRKKKDKEV